MIGNKLTWKIRAARLRQRVFGQRVDIRRSWEETPAQLTDMVEFLNWFDQTKSVAETLERAKTDWQYRFAAGAHFATVPKQRALEIGFGGGRLLMQAARDFKNVVGIDIHENFALSKAFLASQGVTNAELLHRDQMASVASGSVDFVYSFIVFQHFDSMQEVEFYLNEIARVLSPNGIAQIYYGKKEGDGTTLTTADEFRLRDCSLFISPGTMRTIVADRFDVLDYRDDLPRDPLANTGKSVQAMVLFRNKAARSADRTP
jgi:ubiquinone/menaquinone biosynthesis C-methylase UbiE